MLETLNRFYSSALLAIVLTSGAHGAAITYGPLAAPQDPAGGGYPTSVKIIWWTDIATSSNTAYVGASPSGPWTFTGSDAAVGTRHEALVSGLSADAAYWAYVNSDGAASAAFQFRTGLNLLANGSFETWHSATGQGWGTEEPDGWHGWEIYPWSPPGTSHPGHISISKDRNTGIPSPPQKDGSHRVGMDEGWRECYGGIYQEVTGLPSGQYVASGWAAWSFSSITNPDSHWVEVLVKDGPHTPGAEPSGTALLSQNGSASEGNWKYVQGAIDCTTGTLTVYANLRSDFWDGASFAHFDGFRLMQAVQPAVRFTSFQASRAAGSSDYTVTLGYDTDIATTTQVQWGPTVGYGNSSTFDSNLVTHHVVTLSGVSPAVNSYHYRAHATAPGDIDEYSLDQTFDAPQVVLSAIGASVDSLTGTVCMVSWTSSPATTSNSVYYRPQGQGNYSVAADPQDPSPRTSHLITLSGLSLGTLYEYHVCSESSDIVKATSTPDRTFQTPVQPLEGSFLIAISTIGGPLADDGDDIGPAAEVARMIESDTLAVNNTGLSAYSWPTCQPTDPGEGPNVYDWSSGDAANADRIPAKARIAYFDVYGQKPAWVEFDSTRYWQKFEEFVEAMTVHMNENYGDADFIFDNEPNIYRGPSGWNWADWYMHCLQHFYVAVHRADSQTGKTNRVIGGNLCGHSAGSFNSLYSRGFKNYSDVVGYHPYPNDLRSGLEVADLATIHGIQVNYNDAAKKIYVGEGWGSGRSAGFDRSSPTIEPCAEEVENMWLALINGWDNVMTPRTNWDASYLYGMRFFCGNDNWGAGHWRDRAIPQKDGSGNIIGFIVDGYWMTPDIAPAFWNGGMMDWYGNSKDCLIHVFPGNGLVFMNPGFELKSSPPDDHLPHFWTAQADPAPTANYGEDDSVFLNGSRSLRLTQTSPGNNGVWQMTAKRSAAAGVAYRARVRCKTQDSSGLAARFYMRFSNRDGSQKSDQIWAADLAGTADWRLMEVTGTAPSYTDRIEVGCYIAGVGTAWFDDVTIARTDVPETGTVRGYTLDENQVPVAECTVQTTTGSHQTTSDASGYYEMANVPEGTYDFVCRKAGYVPFKVKNQTVAPGRLTYASFNMGLIKPGITVTQVSCAPSVLGSGVSEAAVTVSVTNSKPYPVNISDVGLFVERDGSDETGRFIVRSSPSNPKVVPAGGQSDFAFSLTLADPATADGRPFSINAYAFGQEDRPNMLTNGDFDSSDWSHHWSWYCGAQTCQWLQDSSVFYSPPNSLKHVTADPGTGSFDWAGNYSAWGASAPPAFPDTNYIVGAYHKDTTSGLVDLLLYIEEFYYDGSNWLYNGRHFAAVPHHSAWTNDYILYRTGDPNRTPGIYATNRLRVSVGSSPRQNDSSSTSWWDDVYLKEEGDWLSDDRADSGASLTVAKPVASVSAALDLPDGTWVELGESVVTGGSESFTSRLYVEQPNRAAGCLVSLGSGTAPVRGTEVSIAGSVGNVDGERALVDAIVSSIGAPGAPAPLGLTGREIALEHPVVEGLLAVVWGRVRYVAPDGSYFTIDDGSSLTDGEGHAGIKACCTGLVSALAAPAADSFVRVVGIVGCEQNGALAVIRPRSQADIFAVP